MNSEDRRVRKTRKALQVALAELMNEKELRKITVQELADQADVHRATFYTHYQDVYDLYTKLEDQILEELVHMLSESPEHNYDKIYHNIIDYLLENKAFGYMIFGKFGRGSFQHRITDVIEEQYLKIWLYEEPMDEITMEMRYLTTYHIRGCISIIERWVQRNYSESKEKIFWLLRLVNGNFDQTTRNNL